MFASFLRPLLFSLAASVGLAFTPAMAEEAAPAMTEALKAETIQKADAITAFSADKVVGMAKDWQVYYQEAQSPNMHMLSNLHDIVFVIICVIVLVVLGLMAYICVRFNKRANPKPQTFTHNKMVEIIWTVIPVLILVGIAIPSLRGHYQHYFNENVINNADLTVKIIGRQWYWSYEYPEQGIVFDSNMKTDADREPAEPRLLAVDNPIVVPVNKVVRLQITGADVIHAFALPALGVKKDAVPGRLNETWFKAEKEGIYFGQCSELCGKSHGFMPIQVVVVSEDDFNAWVKGAKLKFAASDHIQFAALN